ncbi:hypothetical protein CgunFtcFv8_012675 [Champsocephalus gunnari]|uniref:Uncharacterized protein n=1 Tax=Champsocephalus gunnari TaxID=52237 RepID=A0AAN8DRY1_CHAGU|nr:hypothetical protein CgunFtcFv8_012675 [Champsocephalus gunnari]
MCSCIGVHRMCLPPKGRALQTVLWGAAQCKPSQQSHGIEGKGSGGSEDVLNLPAPGHYCNTTNMKQPSFITRR